MTREIRYHHYLGCCRVVLVCKTEPNEEWRSMTIRPVAVLWNPSYLPYGTWEEGVKDITAEERRQIEEEATVRLREWLTWSFNPNREQGISDKWIAEQVERELSHIDGEYKIIPYTSLRILSPYFEIKP